MSSSDPDSKIDLIDPPEVVRKKFKKAFCPPEKVEGNGVLSFVQYVLLPASALKNNGTPKFVVPRRDAEPLEYSDIKQIHEDYASGTLQPQTIKPAAVEALLEIMGPIRKAFEESKEWLETEVLAYPPPPAPVPRATVSRTTIPLRSPPRIARSATMAASATSSARAAVRSAGAPSSARPSCAQTPSS